MKYEIGQCLSRIIFFNEQIAKAKKEIEEIRTQCQHKYVDMGSMFFDNARCEECGAVRLDGSTFY